jgi:hypothetical protein
VFVASSGNRQPKAGGGCVVFQHTSEVDRTKAKRAGLNDFHLGVDWRIVTLLVFLEKK